MKAQQKFDKVMHEFGQGTLKSHGETVTDQKRALAIAFNEARKIDPVYKMEDGGRAKPFAFKEGDHVRVAKIITSLNTEKKGMAGYITRAIGRRAYIVSFADGTTSVFTTDELELMPNEMGEGGIIKLNISPENPLSKQLMNLTGDPWSTQDFESVDGSQLTTTKPFRHIKTGQVFEVDNSDKKTYTITFQDTVSGAIEKKQAQLSPGQYKNALDQMKNRDVVVSQVRDNIRWNFIIKNIEESNNLMAAGGALDKQWNFPDYGIASYRDLIDRGVFDGKYKSIENAVAFDRIKFNRMDGFQQQEYYKKLNKKKTSYNLKYAGTETSQQVSKEVYDYANLPELTQKNYYMEYKHEGGSTKSSYRITEGMDHYKGIPLYHVVGVDNDYVGEWHKDKADAEKELAGLGGSSSMHPAVELREKFNIGVGALGNGLTIYDMNRQENNDYKIIAHIQPWGEITWRDSGLSQRVKELIEQQASIEKNENKMAEGGSTNNLASIYAKGTAQQLWEAWDEKQRKHFISDHMDLFIELMGPNTISDTIKATSKYVSMQYNELPDAIKKEVVIHHAMGMYKDGGSMATGGEVKWKGKWKSLEMQKQAFELLKNGDWPFIGPPVFDKTVDYVGIYFDRLESIALHGKSSGGSMAKGGTITPAKRKLQDRIDTLKKSMVSANSVAQRSIQKKIDKLQSQLDYKPTAKQLVQDNKGRFAMDVPAKYSKAIYKKLWSMNIMPRIHKLGSTASIVVNSRINLNKAYKVYSDISLEKVPALAKISRKL